VFTRCLFCHAHFPENDRLSHMPRGRRIAYDAVRGRLWVVCERCGRWSLAPIEERHETLHELERIARDEAHDVGGTANITLLNAPPLMLVRVGKAGLTERSAWRYGREIEQRRAALRNRRVTVAAYTLGAMHSMAAMFGLADPDLSIDWEDAPVVDVMRWRRFGWAAWHGRETCPSCHSTLRALRYDLAWWVYPIRGPGGRVGVGVPCQRCDPWTPDKIYELHGDGAENVLRRLLAYLNVSGASDRRIDDAVRLIERSGSADDFARSSAAERRSFWKMGATGTVGLEIALNESVERRMLDLEARALECLWRQEEELARIIDEELTPRQILDAHLRRLPVRMAPHSRPAGRVGRGERG